VLRPVESGDLRRSVQNVRVYLDDIENVVTGLSAYGSVEIVATHRNGTQSVVGDIGNLLGRKDITHVSIQLAHGVVARVSIGDLLGVEINVDRGHQQVYPTCDHFLSILEQVRPSLRYWFRSLLGRLQVPYVDIRLEHRQSVRERRERLIVELVSGLVGALIGASVTILVVLIQK
jgi:hypothetical protein